MLPVARPTNVRQALAIDVLAARAIARRLGVSTLHELIGLLDKKTEESCDKRLALNKIEIELRAAVPFTAHAAELIALFREAGVLGGSRATAEAVSVRASHLQRLERGRRRHGIQRRPTGETRTDRATE